MTCIILDLSFPMLHVFKCDTLLIIYGPFVVFSVIFVILSLFFQGLTIIAFNNGQLNMKTVKEVLSLGPTYVVMKFIESKFRRQFNNPL